MKKYKVRPDYLYTETHEWIKIENSSGIVGITDYAQDQLHDIVYIELPEIGLNVKKGDVVAEIESVKAVAEIYSPVSGQIIDINKELEGSPELINQSPYDDGWIFKIQISDKNEIKSLLTPEQYLEIIE
ncbi:glycine cleavage system protein GcvH [Candidatus Geothermarchaeota archaeon]|nr:MAG: glycine cleavage system protein GcvH [Candidatus Geothermarchaeota archaeon]